MVEAAAISDVGPVSARFSMVDIFSTKIVPFKKYYTLL
jgi:hypothetical protein